MLDPSSEAAPAVQVLKGLYDEEATPLCFLDEKYVLVYWNAAFDQMVRTIWHGSASELAGRVLLTSLPLPAPLLLALACLQSTPRSEILPRIPMGAGSSVWDVQMLPYMQDGHLTGVAMFFHDRTAEEARERAEQEEHRVLETIRAASKEAWLLVAADGQARIENEAAARLFSVDHAGVTRSLDELLAGTVLLEADGSPLPLERNPFRAAQAGIGLGAATYKLRRPPEPDRWVAIAVTPMLSLQAKQLGSLVSCLDLSQLLPDLPMAIEAAREVSAHSRFLERLLAGIPAVLYYLDTNLRIQMANPYLLERIDRPLERVLGQRAQDVLPFPPDYVATLQDAMHATHSIHLPYLPLVNPETGKRTYWENYLTPVRDQADHLQGLVVLSNEVTWRVELTQALADKVHQLRAILAHIADGVLVVTSTGEFLLLNEAAQRMLPLAPGSNLSALEQLELRTLDDCPVAPEDMPISRVLRGELISETVIKVESGDREWVLATSGTPIYDEQGQVIMGVLVLHDMTEEHRLHLELKDKVCELEGAVASLKELDRLKTNFLNTISHELRTPLTNIMGYVELLEDAIAGPLNATQDEYVGKVMGNARHLLALINDLLDFTQLEAGKIELSLGPVDLRALVDQVMSTVQFKHAKPMGVVCGAVDDLPDARADFNRLQQVLENLLDNAFKFTPAGGRVSVQICQKDGMLRVEIEDTGIGIPAEALPKLFTKFYQVESGLRREQGGTGLGLAISKMLVERMGGQIGISSTSDHGTLVWFMLPVWDEPAGKATPS